MFNIARSFERSCECRTSMSDGILERCLCCCHVSGLGLFHEQLEVFKLFASYILRHLCQVVGVESLWGAMVCSSCFSPRVHQTFLCATCVLGWVNVLLFPVSVAFMALAKLFNELIPTRPHFLLITPLRALELYWDWHPSWKFDWIRPRLDKFLQISWQSAAVQRKAITADPLPSSGGKAEPSSYLFLQQQNGSSVTHVCDQLCCRMWK